jgi:hypothetical protein
MRQWQIRNDNIYDLGEVTYLGTPKEQNTSLLPVDYDGWFPFMRFCYSFGDLGIVSGLFEAMKQKYPKLKIAVPSNDYVTAMFGSKLNQWSYDQKTSAINNMDTVWANNPYIDYRFEKGEFDWIFTDHDRSYSSLIHDGDMVRSCDEPLVEQILRRFGFTEKDLQTVDSKPKLYFTPDEIKKNTKTIFSKVQERDYGCLLFASRLEWAKGRWEKDYLLYEAAEKFKGLPVFYFSEFDIKETEWGKYFPEAYNFADMEISIRDQIYIKRHAKFNISYQAGVTDASNGSGSEMHILCPYPTIRENCIRDTHYYYLNRDEKTV